MRKKTTFLMLLNASILSAAVVPVGQGGYETTLPVGQQGPSNQNGQPASPKVTPNFAQPPKTNSWWSSLIWQYDPISPWSKNLFAHPLAFNANNEGLALGYPTNVNISPYTTTSKGVKVHEFHYPFVEDLRVGIQGLNAPSTQVDSYSDWAVTAAWQAGNRQLKATVGKGLPFAYFTTQGDNARIRCVSPPEIWSNNNGVIGLSVNGHHYGIFGPQGTNWTTGQTLTSDLGGKGYFSVAVLPDNTPATLEFYRKHAYAFVQNTQVNWNYDTQAGRLQTTFTVNTTLKETGPDLVNQPLVALYRHQWLNTNQSLTNYIYTSARGAMKVADTSSFTTSLPVSGVLPELPLVAIDGVDTFNKEQLYSYVDMVYKQTPFERWNKLNNGDTYWEGKAMGKISHLIHAANQVGHQDAKALFLQELENRLTGWLDAAGPQLFYYDNQWKTLIGFPASYGSNTEINDHHFHYGYFLLGAATVAMYDPEWAAPSAWGGMVEMLIKDASNPDRADTRFPFLRCFDPYEGHAWASGHAVFAAGNNEESSSESIQYASALTLWGSITGNQALRDLGVYLHTTEAASVFQYWFNIDKEVFPQEFPEPTIGILWGDGGAYAIWWDGTINELHGINFLPIHGGSLYLGMYPNYLKTNEDWITSHGDAGVWFDIHLGVKALYSPSLAISQFNANANYEPEPGDSKAHTYQWIHNLNKLGILETAITADIPTAAVFNRAGTRVYTAFNPTNAPLNVRFSDGFTLSVPALQVTSSESSNPPTPPSPSPSPSPAPAPTPNPPAFNQGVDDVGSGVLRIWTNPVEAATSATIVYAINGAMQTTGVMTQNNGRWEYSLRNVAPQSRIDYYFLFQYSTVQSPSFSYTYSSSSPETPYTVTITPTSNSAVLVEFQAPQRATFVDLHYKINNGGQQNVRMQQNNMTWDLQVDGLRSGDTFSYSFTYFTDVGYDTDWKTYTQP